MKVAEQIRTEDPEAYEYLQGTKGMERIGAGFIAMLASIMFALFDLTASLLVLLGFLIFRWAVIAAPILGTVGLLRPASAGFRRLANAVVAALFNIVIFGTGAADLPLRGRPDHEHADPAGLAAGRAGLAVRRRGLAAAAAVPADHSARRQGLGGGDRLGRHLASALLPGRQGDRAPGGGQAGRRCRESTWPTGRRNGSKLRAEPPLPGHRARTAATRPGHRRGSPQRRMPAPAGDGWTEPEPAVRAGLRPVPAPPELGSTTSQPSRRTAGPGRGQSGAVACASLLRRLGARTGVSVGSDRPVVAAIVVVARLGGGRTAATSAHRTRDGRRDRRPTAGDDARGRARRRVPSPTTTPCRSAASTSSTAWLQRDRESSGVARGAVPLSTTSLAESLEGVDPVGVPATRMTGEPTVVLRTELYAQVNVPVDTGTVVLGLVKQDDRWLVDSVDWDRA